MIVSVTLHIAIDCNGGFSVDRVPDGADLKAHKAFETKHWPSWKHEYRKVELDLPLSDEAQAEVEPKREEILWT